jgi:hypothetical protein
MSHQLRFVDTYAVIRRYEYICTLSCTCGTRIVCSCDLVEVRLTVAMMR